MTDRLAPVLAQIENDFDAGVARLCEILRIPSVGTDPAHDDDTRRAAQWFADQLAELGFDAAVHDTPGQPMVVAHLDPPGATGPRVLYYGHYDVQPPDPIELWDTGPFDPAIVDGPAGQRIVARGAVDDKGQSMTWLEAFRAWRAVHGELPLRITVLMEGEEESGSPSLAPFLKAQREALAADVCVISDTGMWDIETPAVTFMLRGLVYIEATLHGPSHDLHSGQYGGAGLNPLNAITRVLGQLHDESGRVQIDGFYNDVIEPAAEERAAWAALGFDEAQFLSDAGLKTPVGEAGYSTLERVWARPTCDINGIWGGYTGAGAKTVIADAATAKISCRLVANQDPKSVYDGLVRFLEDRTPPDGRWTITSFGMEPAIRVPTDSPWLDAARDALDTAFGTPARLVGTGGSIPVVGLFKTILGLDSLLIGFSLGDDRVHSPNEKFELRCLKNGIRSHAALLEELSRRTS